MANIKIERINNNLVKEISYVISTEVKDKDIGFVTITAVDTASDLSSAKVYFTVLNDSQKELSTESLNNAAGFIRSKLFDLVDMRNVPTLTFIYDESIEYGKRIEDIIEEING